MGKPLPFNIHDPAAVPPEPGWRWSPDYGKWIYYFSRSVDGKDWHKKELMIDYWREIHRFKRLHPHSSIPQIRAMWKLLKAPVKAEYEAWKRSGRRVGPPEMGETDQAIRKVTIHTAWHGALDRIAAETGRRADDVEQDIHDTGVSPKGLWQELYGDLDFSAPEFVRGIKRAARNAWRRAKYKWKRLA